MGVSCYAINHAAAAKMPSPAADVFGHACLHASHLKRYRRISGHKEQARSTSAHGAMRGTAGFRVLQRQASHGKSDLQDWEKSEPTVLHGLHGRRPRVDAGAAPRTR